MSGKWISIERPPCARAFAPSFRRLAPVIDTHDEQEQFLHGVELILAGARAQLT